MANKRQIDGWIKSLEKRKTAIGKERDRLSAWLMEIDQLIETCERAYEDVQAAIDALSELT